MCMSLRIRLEFTNIVLLKIQLHFMCMSVSTACMQVQVHIVSLGPLELQL